MAALLLALGASLARAEGWAGAVLRVPAPYEEAVPDASFEYEDFRQSLAGRARSDRWLVPCGSLSVLLVVEKGYLDGAGLDRLASEVQEAVSGIPEFTRRPPRIQGRFALFVSEGSPPSNAGGPGIRKGEKGVFLKFYKEDRSPLFHELTHLLAGSSHSQSLSDGMADCVQDRFRPGKANAFTPAGTDPDEKAREALEPDPSWLLSTVGSPGFPAWTGEEAREGFYYCSWSFVRFLIRRGGMAAAWSLLDAGGAEEAYVRAFGKGRDRLVGEWARSIGARAPSEKN
jgi:hypothetical protein